MSFLKFLSYRKSYVAGAIFAMLFACFVLFLAGVNIFFAMLLILAMLACLAWPLFFDYRKSKDFYKSILDFSDSVSLNSDVYSELPPPQDALQELIFDFVSAYDKLSKNLFGEAQSSVEDYCAYIESWVHEIKTPLAASVLVADRLQTSEKSELMNQFELINQELEEVLWYARSNSVGKDYRIKPIKLHELIVNVCKKNARYLIEKGCIPTFDVPDDVVAYCDEKWTSFIITQAVINSAKYHAKSICFSSESKGSESFEKSIVLHVKDDGDGIPESDLPFVFEPAFVGGRGRENATSTGMGLYLCAKMCKKLGLGIEIKSQEYVGTIFSLEFPYDDTSLQFCNKSVS